jgi:hypothetical protein
VHRLYVNIVHNLCNKDFITRIYNITLNVHYLLTRTSYILQSLNVPIQLLLMLIVLPFVQSTSFGRHIEIETNYKWMTWRGPSEQDADAVQLKKNCWKKQESRFSVERIQKSRKGQLFKFETLLLIDELGSTPWMLMGKSPL